MSDRLEAVRQAGEDEVLKWTDSRFGGVAGFKAGRDYQAGKVGGDSETDPRFSQLDTKGGNALKAGIEELSRDPEVLERIARETGDPDLIAEVTEQHEEREANKFLARHPGYNPTNGNYEAIRAYLAAHDLTWEEPNITKAYRSLLRSGELQTRPGQARNLSASEQLYVISLCKTGQVTDAIAQYLNYSYPDSDDLWASAGDFLSDPETLDARNDAVRFVFYQSRPVSDSAEWRSFQKQFFRGRPAIALADLDACWSQFQEHQRDVTRGAVLDQLNTDAAQPTAEDIDQLDDDGVKRLYQATRKHIAKTSRRGTGILL
jgi:hypothetical protein